MKKNDTALWEAAGMLGEKYLTEAENYRPKNRSGRYAGRRILIAAAAAALVLTGVGFTAQKWVFAPGQGMVSADVLTEMHIYTSGEKMPLGKVQLEAVTVTEDPVDPMNNRITLWVYRSPADQMGDGSMDEEGKGYLEGNSFTAKLNGTEYRSYGSGYGTTGWGCYTFGPIEDRGTPPALNGVCEVTVAYEEPDMAVEPVTLTLTPAAGQTAKQQFLTRDTALTLMPLTDNLVIGSFTHPAWQPLIDRAHSISTHVNFLTTTEDGTEGYASGSVNLNGEPVDTDCIRVNHDGYDKGITAMAMYDLRVDFFFTPESLPGYTFSLMETGETHVPQEDVYLLDEGGLRVKLLSVTQDRDGLHYETEYTSTDRDKNVRPSSLILSEYSVGAYAYQNGTEYISNPAAKLNVHTEEDGILTRFTGEEDHVLEPGEPVTVYVQYALVTYGMNLYEDGAGPVCEIALD